MCIKKTRQSGDGYTAATCPDTLKGKRSEKSWVRDREADLDWQFVGEGERGVEL